MIKRVAEFMGADVIVAESMERNPIILNPEQWIILKSLFYDHFTMVDIPIHNEIIIKSESK